jgi:hypothetical protein
MKYPRQQVAHRLSVSLAAARRADSALRASATDEETNKQLRALAVFLKSGRPIFSENRGQKEAHSTRVLRRRLRASRGRGDPDGREELQRVRVTADDIRHRYPAPVSGILAPQRVSNLRIVTKL